jgi:hypothetical protein
MDPHFSILKISLPISLPHSLLAIDKSITFAIFKLLSGNNIESKNKSFTLIL